jgi:type III pantothenate kinase
MQSKAGLLTVDRGNSTIDCLFHADGARLRLPTHERELGPLRAWLGERTVARCLLASVVTVEADQLRGLLQAVSQRVELVGLDLPCPLRVAYAEPRSLGVDRWLGALAAHRMHGRAVVVDCGSATTVNLVDADGTFLGGCIAPGLGALVAGMAAATPSLPKPDLAVAPRVPATDTPSAVVAGVLLGYCGMVERLVADCVRVAPGPVRIVLTGGNADVLRQSSRLVADVASDLVHQGMRILATEIPCRP